MSFRDLPLRSGYTAADNRLNDFYVPLFKAAVSYDRVSGYFSSSSLATAAAGLSHFIARGGTMRLIAGAQFNEDDLKAVLDGVPLTEVLAQRLMADPLTGTDIVSEHRLETLAWLVREGRLHIRIGVPVDHLGRPLRPDQTDRYFHSKYGVFTDEVGNRVAFEGSNNETMAGMQGHHESFSVFPSWMSEVWQWNGQPIVQRFEDHWQDRPAAGWKILSVPEAVAERLVSRVKGHPRPPKPEDPEEVAGSASAEDDAIRLAFVAAAPRLGGGTGVGFATAGVEPWPHQLAIARRAVATFPRSYLLADEVGLGKTIEAGLILRELLVSGKARTALLLTPASVLRQWQEELYEKFALHVPRFDGGRFLDLEDGELPHEGSAPWSAFRVVLASSHLARRRERRGEIIAAGPWDLVLVDEAHHARRSGSKPTDTPNKLLALLEAMKAAGSWKALYLASATPMQMHAHEAWDLLSLLGLTGRWAGCAEAFVRFYTELRRPFEERDWQFLQRMAADYFADPGVVPDPELEAEVRKGLGMAGSNPVRKFHLNGLSEEAAIEMRPDARAWMDEWLRGHTPMRERVFRTTRSLLRRYKDEGLLRADATIPHRIVTDRFVPMTPQEQALYRRIETYISRYYDSYMKGPAKQKPLGFIMTVYRRRLTSSFLAIERSLRRRRDVLLGTASTESLLDSDDIATLESSGLLDLWETPERGRGVAAEINELTSFLDELDARPPDESKMARLHDELEDAFRDVHDTVIIFTQYTDTMDYLRDQLRPWYGSKVVCYSGRGGQRWDEQQKLWAPLTKTEVKNQFREGREVKILIGTDSLSEGLNLQTCGKLINYDMPWNFMRVEQRIGRVDRINGRPRVDVSNYFYEGTVETQVYAGIREDYDWFTDIVGPAQPVLSEVESIIEDVAMHEPGVRRDELLGEAVAQIRKRIEDAKERALTLQDVGGVPNPEFGGSPAIDLPGLEQVLLRALTTARQFRPHPSIPGAYLIGSADSAPAVTFRRSVLDLHAPEVGLLTYEAPEFEKILARSGVHHNDQGVFEVRERSVCSLAELEAALSSGLPKGEGA